VWEEARGCVTPQRCGAGLDLLRVWGREDLFCFFDVAGGVEVEEDPNAPGWEGAHACLFIFSEAAAAQFSMEHSFLLLLHEVHDL